jgi:hypothetical protein
MNRIPVLTGVFFFLTLPSFSLDLSTGYGLITGASFDTLSAEVGNGAGTSMQKYNQFHFGASVFFDADYIAANINFYGTATTFSYNSVLKEYTKVNGDFKLSGTNLAMGLRFKYPFNAGNIKIFPLLGIQGNIGLSQNFSEDSINGEGKKSDNYGDAANWSALAFEAGGGVDINIREDIYFRANLVMNYKINSKLDDAFIKSIDKSTAQNLNLGFEADFLIGYRFGQTSFLQPGSPRVPAPSKPGPSGDDDIFYPK